MSRLNSVIRRLQAQRDCLNAAAEMIKDQDGIVLEVGLGNGRTFDHLREIMPDREIFVFDRQIAAHPKCIPDDDHLFLGDIFETLPMAAERFKGKVALVHSDVGTGDEALNAKIASFIGQTLPPALIKGAIVASDQKIDVPGTIAEPLPEGVPKDRYFFRRFQG
ncbi:class I SAM-dependent methyltransferase [Thalassospira lucentensis]|uniref:class I SAM-dependent methyltransferase n=1 Tax=Thalassospira lucentensis TaxID=168935 RepID=UPI00399D5F98